jgi:LIM domain-binding protein 1
MGGEFGDEDERLITRLENTQYDPAVSLDDPSGGGGGGPPSAPPSQFNSGPPGKYHSLKFLFFFLVSIDCKVTFSSNQLNLAAGPQGPNDPSPWGVVPKQGGGNKGGGGDAGKKSPAVSQ